MAQPIKKIRKKKPVEGIVKGLDYCDDCPFFTAGYCHVNDIQFDVKEKVPVPDNCGNKKQKPEV